MEATLTAVIRIGRTLLEHWREAFSSSDQLGKIFLVVIPLGMLCSLCSIPLVLLPSDPTPTMVAALPTVELEDQSNVVVVTRLVTALPTDSPTAMPPTSTQIPTDTAVPTETPSPTDTPLPSDTPLPTDTNTPVPPTLTPTPAYPPGQEALVTEVIDGDTIRVNIDGTVYPVRYIGMDTPETGEPFAELATQANEDLVLGQTVILVKDVSETDRYGRLLRYVYLMDGTFVNAKMIQLGFAEAVAYPPDVLHQQEFEYYQENAQKLAVGYWGLPTATPLPTWTAIPLPTATAVLVQATQPPPEPACDPNYTGACILIGVGDYDCAGGSGNGPNYVRGPVYVVGVDIHDLDRDGDGVGCE